MIYCRGKFHTISDPMRRPGKAVPSAVAPIGTLHDKLLIAKLRGELLEAEIDQVLSAPEVSTLTALREYGFSEKIIERFYRPFLGGIFLDPELATSSRMFQFVYRMFAQGTAAIPNGGMQAIPKQLASHLNGGSIRFNAPVQHVWEGGVRLESGEELFAGAVVVACDPVRAARLLPEAGIRTAMRGVRCLYFAAADPPVGGHYLVSEWRRRRADQQSVRAERDCAGICAAGISPGIGDGAACSAQRRPPDSRCARAVARLVWRAGEWLGVFAVVSY